MEGIYILKYNTFRADRFLRSEFIEGKYLLSSEASDITLESLNVTRNVIKNNLGDVAIGDAWKVTTYRFTTTVHTKVGSDFTFNYPFPANNVFVGPNDSVYKSGNYVGSITSGGETSSTFGFSNPGNLSVNDTVVIVTTRCLLVSYGEAYYRGLPFFFRNGEDSLVALGQIPAGKVTSLTEPYGLGKILVFRGPAPSFTPPNPNKYDIVISANEEIVNSIEDPFLQNANIPESTAQKVRLVYSINVVPSSEQTETPNPYTGSDVAPFNLVNRIKITPTTGGIGSLVSSMIQTGTAGTTGANWQISLLSNNVSSTLPTDPGDLLDFYNGTLIDSYGNSFRIVSMNTDSSTGPFLLVISLDLEAATTGTSQQALPQIVDGVPYYLVKQDVYSTDSNGNPVGDIYWPVGSAVFNSSGFVHDSVVTDLRTSILTQEQFQKQVDLDFTLKLTAGGTLQYGVIPNIFSWNSTFTLVNPTGPSQTIPTSSAAIIEGGSLVYEMNLLSGGSIAKGNLATNISSISAGGVLNVSAGTNLEKVVLGNVIQNSVGDIAHIIAVDNIAKQLTISASWPSGDTGAAIIYLDSYGPEMAPTDKDLFTLAVRNNNQVFVGPLELSSGETNTLANGISQAILTYIGTPNELTATPTYSSVFIVTQGVSLTTAIGELDYFLQQLVTAPLYDERILYPAVLVAGTPITIPVNSRNAGAQETYVVGSGDLEIYVNGTFRFTVSDYDELTSTTISFVYDLPPDSEVRFRKANFGGAASSGGGGGGSPGSLQDAYNLGSSILTLAGIPVTITGPAGTVLHVLQNIQLDGIIL